MNNNTMNPAQKALWADLMSDYKKYPEGRSNMTAWAEFLKGITAYDGQATCRWNDTTVFLDAEAPYVDQPHPDFPIIEEEHNYTFYSAWTPQRQPPPEHLAPLEDVDTDYRTYSDVAGTQTEATHELQPSDDLDQVCRRVTAFGSFGDMVDSMRANDGYGQKYVPTLRLDERGAPTPQAQQDMKALRAGVQAHGFEVSPADEEYERRSMLDEPEDLPALDELEYHAEGYEPEAGD
ncbi:MAG: hypothetical protein AAF449_19535 [Myxococcota bacterium]